MNNQIEERLESAIKEHENAQRSWCETMNFYIERGDKENLHHAERLFRHTVFLADCLETLKHLYEIKRNMLGAEDEAIVKAFFDELEELEKIEKKPVKFLNNEDK